ncbi:MAG: hypothetical protein ACLPSF_06650 [Methylocella sp.]
MAQVKLIVSIFALGLAALALPAPVHANSLGTVDGLPFFGRPYPYYYVYHRPPAECYEAHPVDTPDGPRIELDWVCGGAVRARY